MRWSQKNPLLVNQIRKYIRESQEDIPLIIKNFNKIYPFDIQSESGIRALLIYSSLNQKISEKHLTELLEELFKQFPDNSFHFQLISFEKLKSSVRSLTKGWNWELGPKIPGILRSAGDFFYSQKSILSLLKKEDTETIVHILSSKIFFMGKHSVNKYKARFFILLCLHVLGKKSLNWNPNSLLPITEGAFRLMHFIGPLKGKGKRQWGIEEKLLYYNQFLSFLDINNPWIPFRPLQNFQRRSLSMEFECQKWFQGCSNCSLNNQCNTSI